MTPETKALLARRAQQLTTVPARARYKYRSILLADEQEWPRRLDSLTRDELHDIQHLAGNLRDVWMAAQIQQARARRRDGYVPPDGTRR